MWESFHVQFKLWGRFLIWTQKNYHFFFKKAHCYGLKSFLDNYLFMRPQNLATNFSEKERYWLLLCSNDVSTLWLLITLCNMTKGLVTYLQGKQQLNVYICCRVISWAMWVCNTTQGFLLVSCYWYKGFSIIVDIHK